MPTSDVGHLAAFHQLVHTNYRYELIIPTITSYVVFIDGRGIVVDKDVYESP